MAAWRNGAWPKRLLHPDEVESLDRSSSVARAHRGCLFPNAGRCFSNRPCSVNTTGAFCHRSDTMNADDIHHAGARALTAWAEENLGPLSIGPQTTGLVDRYRQMQTERLLRDPTIYGIAAAPAALGTGILATLGASTFGGGPAGEDWTDTGPHSLGGTPVVPPPLLLAALRADRVRKSSLYVSLRSSGCLGLSFSNSSAARFGRSTSRGWGIPTCWCWFCRDGSPLIAAKTAISGRLT